MLDPVYPILDRRTCDAANVDPDALVRMWLDLGIKTFQIRDKQNTESDYIEFARGIKESFPDARLIANDFARAALNSDQLFTALHLGQEDWSNLPPALKGDLDAACKRGFKLGLSTHTFQQFQAAAGLNLAYTAIGPVMATTSKPGGTDPVVTAMELEQIFREAARTQRQLVVIGGLGVGNLEKILFRDRLAWFPENLRPVPAIIQAALRRDEIQAMLDILKD
ncbi:MAG: thiamine phosphate synthase [Spirochaetia bacterium]|nr:thiamine phosphate synthase [Spirochaetia bacterium]